MKEQCSNCKFWFLDTGDYGDGGPKDGMFKGEILPGICHRYAPQPARISKQEALCEDKNDWPMTRWPETRDYNWCGEWEDKDLDIGISWFDMSWGVRTRNALGRAGISSVKALVQKKPQELLALRNFGLTSLREVERNLAMYDLCLLGAKPCSKD